MKPYINIRQTLLGALLLGLLTIGCKDDFNEEVLLETQVDLAEQQDIDKAGRAAEALNASGELLSYAIKVVSNNNEPVAGASVTLQAAAQSGAEFDTQTITTDASGQAFFERAVIGGNILSISADGFFDITAHVDFGTIDEGEHFQIIEGEIVPTPVTESSILPLISNAAAVDAGTLSGVVTIETDLTNTTPEVPQDLTLRVNLANFASQFNVGGSIIPDIYTFSDAMVIGSAQVDNTTGAYSMQVPALGEELDLELLIPDISAHQRLAITTRNDIPLPRPEYVEIPTNFGPNWSSDSSIPNVPGVIWVFDAPAPAGSGFDLTYEKIGRGFQEGPFVTYDFADFVDPAPLNNTPGYETTIIQTNAGSDIINAPLFTVTDPTGANAVGRVRLEFAIDRLSLSQTGSGFMPNSLVDFNFYYDFVTYNDNNGMLETLEIVDNVNIAIDLDVMTDENGNITQENIDAALADILNQQIIPDGFDPANPFIIPAAAGQFNLRFQSDSNNDNNTCIIGVSGVSVGRAESFQLWTPDNSDSYTDPTFEFTGGAGEVGFTMPSIEVVSFGTQWEVTANNEGVTAPYTLPPSEIKMEYIPITTVFPKIPVEATELLNSDDDLAEIVGLLEADANGDVQFINQLTSYRTPFFTEDMPKTLLVEPQSTTANVFIDALSTNENGSITDFDLDIFQLGKGYTDQFTARIEPAAEGAPGSGALVDLLGGEFAPNGEYLWDGDFELKSGGSGYLENLNQKNAQTFQGSFNQPVQAGQTYIVNIRYGTGQKQEKVN